MLEVSSSLIINHHYSPRAINIADANCVDRHIEYTDIEMECLSRCKGLASAPIPYAHKEITIYRMCHRKAERTNRGSTRTARVAGAGSTGPFRSSRNPRHSRYLSILPSATTRKTNIISGNWSAGNNGSFFREHATRRLIKVILLIILYRSLNSF